MLVVVLTAQPEAVEGVKPAAGGKVSFITVAQMPSGAKKRKKHKYTK